MRSRIVIADDHPLFRAALGHAVAKAWPDAEKVEVASAGEARKALQDGADCLLLDLHMEDSHGLGALMDFRQDFPAIPVVIVSASEETRVHSAAAQLGASAFIPKSASLDEMREALVAVRDGDNWFPESGDAPDDDLARIATLTPAQRRILDHMRAGLLNKQIAYELEISEATVKAHITAIFRKLNVVSRTQAAMLSSKLDVVQPAASSVAD